MESRRNQVLIPNLRQLPVAELQIQVQDVLNLPIGQLAPQTLADIFALADAGEQLPTALARDLANYRDKLVRQLADLPDGAELAALVAGLNELPPEHLPAALREALAGQLEGRSSEEVVGALREAVARWEGVEPAPVSIPEPAPAPAAAAMPAAKPKKKATTRRRTTKVDERREEWIREDVTSRLVNYGSRGLKEAIVVAGARHRSPWNDLTEAEILVVLRRMKREGVLRYSAGRWMMNT